MDDLQTLGPPGGFVNVDVALPPLSDFEIIVEFGWVETAASNMMKVGAHVLDSCEGWIGAGLFDDAWIGNTGSRVVCATNAGCDVTGQGTMPQVGSATVRVVRSGGLTSVRWNEEVIVTGASDAPATALRLRFAEGMYQGQQTFGDAWVERVSITGQTTELDPLDLNCDGTTGAADLAVLLAQWGPCAGCTADFDGDGEVGCQ